MEISIRKGSINDIDACEAALVNSKLGANYFAGNKSARNALEEGFAKDEIYVAIDKNNNCTGFIWFIMKSIFHSFPYLHIIAVKEEYRSQGIGKQLLNFFETNSFKEYSKVFLVVADFNPEAKRLYEAIGYQEVGAIPSLYREGITEYLMMKLKKDNRS